MSISSPFIRRPVATTLLTLAVTLAGVFAFMKLPVAPLPQVDFPTIFVQATLPGASPDTVATSVAAPLERHLGQIADVSEMTSTSSIGSARIILQFGLDRDIDGAARDVEAAINAARADLPTALRQNPTYRKVNPADSPIMILALTSDTLTPGQLYDAASTVIQQKLSQLHGIGEVDVGGSALPAVRVEANPLALAQYGIGLEDVRAALASANANSPKGAIEDGARRFQLYTNDQARKAAEYAPLIVAYRNGRAVRLTDVATVEDSVEDLRNAGLYNGHQAITVILYREPGANIISAVQGVKDAIPQLKAALPGSIAINIALDRTPTIKASLADTERALVIAVLLVILVVFAFLRDWRATLIPAVAVPVSIIGTFAGMSVLGYSLDTLSLMALTVATGFVVDDAIVVLENVQRHIEDGMGRAEAALRGAREVGFTVLSMSLSLIAVFLPILLMGGIVGRLFREFAVTLSLSILVSLVVSLTTTPMMCAFVLRQPHRPGDPDPVAPPRPPGRLARAGAWLARGGERGFDAMLRGYELSLGVALRHPRLVMLSLLATIGLNVALFKVIPKGFFPVQDSGQLIGGVTADQAISFQAMKEKVAGIQQAIGADPAVDSVVGFTGGRQTNSAFIFTTLKPQDQRPSAPKVLDRLRRRLARVPGAQTFLVSAQDVRAGGRQSNAAYQYTLQGDDAQELYAWTPRLTEALKKLPILTDVNSDQQEKGHDVLVSYDRPTLARLGLTPAQIDNTLYDAFGQRQVSTIYNALNQYHVVLEVAPKWTQNPQSLQIVRVSTAGGTASGTSGTNASARAVSGPASRTSTTQSTTQSDTQAASTVAPATTGVSGSATADASQNSQINAQNNALAASGKSGGASSGASVSTSAETMVPLSAFTRVTQSAAPLAVNHQGPFVASTISFNMAQGHSLSEATVAIARTMAELRVPTDIHGSFAGTAAQFQSSVSQEPLLVLAALVAVYIVLGVLYESTIHPLTILSTLPSAGVGAVLALLVTGQEFSIIALIGIILLIGIVKKNAILLVDFALAAEREDGFSTEDAIFQACMLRFRPIMMTTFAALLGALPLAFGGPGGELRQPLGISIVGGLIVSQALTLYTTPVVYIYLDRLRGRFRGRRSDPVAA
ncbi:MAG: efflux RND transporter permease subunit [Janthinobacterium lividum]